MRNAFRVTKGNQAPLQYKLTWVGRSQLDSQNVNTAPETTYNLSSYAMYAVVSFVRCALSSST